MNFLQPAYLAALAAAAIPLIIHLLSRRRVPEVPFSSLRFLGGASRRSMRRVDLKRLLLLLLRTAAIVLVVLAFASPVIEGRLAALFPGDAPKAVVIMVDRSYSMSVRESGGTPFERALEAAVRAAGGAGDSDEITVALFDEGCEVVYSSTGLPAEGAAGITRGLEPSWGGTDLGGALSFARSMLARSRRGAGEIFLVSDLQRSGLRRAEDPPGEGPARKAGSGGAGDEPDVPARIFIVPVQPGPGSNVAVESVTVPAAPVHLGETVRIEAMLRNTSPDLEARVPVRLTVGGALAADRETVLPAGGSRVESFEFTALEPGWTRGTVGCREDRLRADDTRRFALKVRERARVLLLSGGEDLYLRQALSPGGYEGDIMLERRGWNDYTSADLERADVVLAGPGGRPGGDDAALLVDYASKGNRVVVFVTRETAGLAGEVSRWRPAIEFRAGGFVSPGAPPETAGILEPLGGAGADGFLDLKFRSAPEISGVPAQDVVLRFDDGSPFIWLEKREEGEVVFAAADPVPEGGDLALSPWFLPLVRQLALAPAEGGARARSALVGSSVRIPGFHPEGCTAALPGGAVYEAASPGRGGPVTIPAGGSPGFISVVCGEDTTRLVAVNPDSRRESDLSYMSAGEAADSLGVGAWAGLEADAGMERSLERAREGREISHWLIAAALALLAAELAVAQTPERGVGRG